MNKNRVLYNTEPRGQECEMPGATDICESVRLGTLYGATEKRKEKGEKRKEKRRPMVNNGGRIGDEGQPRKASSQDRWRSGIKRGLSGR